MYTCLWIAEKETAIVEYMYPPHSLDLASCDFWLIPSILDGKTWNWEKIETGCDRVSQRDTKRAIFRIDLN